MQLALLVVIFNVVPQSQSWPYNDPVAAFSVIDFGYTIRKRLGQKRSILHGILSGASTYSLRETATF